MSSHARILSEIESLFSIRRWHVRRVHFLWLTFMKYSFYTVSLKHCAVDNVHMCWLCVCLTMCVNLVCIAVSLCHCIQYCVILCCVALLGTVSLSMGH